MGEEEETGLGGEGSSTEGTRGARWKRGCRGVLLQLCAATVKDDFPCLPLYYWDGGSSGMIHGPAWKSMWASQTWNRCGRLARQKWELERERRREGGRCEGKEVELRSSLKSTRVGCSPPELSHAGELRSEQCGRGKRWVKFVDVLMERCYREFDQQGVWRLVPMDSFGLKLLVNNHFCSFNAKT